MKIVTKLSITPVFGVVSIAFVAGSLPASVIIRFFVYAFKTFSILNSIKYNFKRTKKFKVYKR